MFKRRKLKIFEIERENHINNMKELYTIKIKIEEDIIKTNQIIEFNSLKSKLRTQLSVLKNKAINGGMSISTYIEQKMAILCNIEVIDKELDKLINDKNSK